MWSPYTYTWNNPISNIDPDGRHTESTHLDQDGNVVAVYQDGDNGVYQHGTNADGTTVTESQLYNRHSRENSGAGGTKVGETEHWDEFISPETGQVMTNVNVQVGKSFDPIVSSLADKADKMSLKQIAHESRPGGSFDIKSKYKNTGGLLNGKYATARSAGNYLAGYNAEGGTMFGVSVSFQTFQKLAGGLHKKGSLSNKEKAGVVLFGTSYGNPPAYGENIYQYRMSKKGWYDSKSKR